MKYPTFLAFALGFVLAACTGRLDHESTSFAHVIFTLENLPMLAILTLLFGSAIRLALAFVPRRAR